MTGAEPATAKSELVVVFRPEADRGVWIEVKGRLSALVGEKAFPDATIVGRINGSGRGTRTPDTRIMIPLL